MSKPVVIDGWRCEVLNGDTRCVQGPGGEGATLTESGASFDAVSIPPAVLAWLIRPLLREAWESGACHAVEEAPVDDWSTRKVDAVYAANPHKDH